MILTVRIRVSGRVQGVSYRFWTAQEAGRRDISGWVRNLPDGCVEAVLSGDADQVDAMVEACRTGPTAARVAHVEVEEYESGEKLSGFTIVR